MSKRTNYRQQLRRTKADFSNGNIPVYTVDTFPTPEGTLGIRLEPKVRIGITKNYTNQSTNIYWFCRHLEESGWLVKDCYVGKQSQKEIYLKGSGSIYQLNLTLPYSCYVYIIVRKIEEIDLEKKK